ncbi:hypothetical protein QAD02_015773 [Eretmocerus hayati]|uniref:Uncharacterized protein n=1 Tax=Eretmocerus hayati TaxID=131215 RepID=A0ACC2P968_9HYME|nr:hypothetical protein QAD02_015773 [Eretmocerus hayati]
MNQNPIATDVKHTEIVYSTNHSTSNQQRRVIDYKTTPAATPEPNAQPEKPDSESRPQSQSEVIEIVESTDASDEAKGDTQEEQTQQPEPKVEEPADEDTQQENQSEKLTVSQPSTEVDVEFAVTMDRDKIKELVTTEISLERQLESVQSQLLALKQLPSEIEKHLQVVSQQLHKIMELSGAQQQQQQQSEAPSQAQEDEDVCCRREQRTEEQDEGGQTHEESSYRDEEFQQYLRVKEDDQPVSDAEADESSSWAPHLISTDPDFSITTESKELEISVKSNEDDGKRVKKYIVSYESEVIQEAQKAESTRTCSPAPSHTNYEPDPNLTLQDQLVQELKHRKGKKRGSRDHLWQPQAKQLELTYGRKWRCPNDFFNDEMIADVLSSQAEVIRGRALGVNFKKFEKTSLPNYDHLMNSSVYKMIHRMEAEPKKGIPARPPKVIAAEDIIERVNTPVCCMANC